MQKAALYKLCKKWILIGSRLLGFSSNVHEHNRYILYITSRDRTFLTGKERYKNTWLWWWQTSWIPYGCGLG